MDSNSYSKSPLGPVTQNIPLASEALTQESAMTPIKTPMATSTMNASPASEAMLQETQATAPRGLGRFTQSAADRLHKAASDIREQGSHMGPGVFSEKLVQKTANVLDDAAQYIDQTSPQSVKDAFTNQVRKHPWLVMGVGLTLGVWLGTAIKRR